MATERSFTGWTERPGGGESAGSSTKFFAPVRLPSFFASGYARQSGRVDEWDVEALVEERHWEGRDTEGGDIGEVEDSMGRKREIAC